jgi:hypothetical protein
MASVVNSIGPTIVGSSFSGLLTRVEIGHIRSGSAGKGRIKSRGSGSSLTTFLKRSSNNVALASDAFLAFDDEAFNLR